MGLEEAWQRYVAASRAYRKLLRDTPAEQLDHPTGGLTLAREATAESLMQYLEALRTVARLGPQGEVAGEQSCRG